MSMKLIMLGPPGSGKGTYASRIGPKFGIPHISTGDIFRAEVLKGSELGKSIDGLMKSGKFVPDEIVIETIKRRLAEADAKDGFILDGYPRTIPQAEALEKITGVDAVVKLDIPEDILIEKMCARWSCKNCGKIYNLADIKREGISMPPMLPKKEGICDECGGPLAHREDDNPKIIGDRIEVYKKQTSPLIDYYEKKGLIRNIKITGPPEFMVPIIMDTLGKGRK